MKDTRSIEVTYDQWNTIYTALRLELERNVGKRDDVAQAIQSAIEAVQAALTAGKVRS